MRAENIEFCGASRIAATLSLEKLSVFFFQERGLADETDGNVSRLG